MVFKPGQPKIAGRKAGTPNKHTQQLKDAILEAAAGAGGGSIAAYLQEQAKANPGPCLDLLLQPNDMHARLRGGRHDLGVVQPACHHGVSLIGYPAASTEGSTNRPP